MLRIVMTIEDPEALTEPWQQFFTVRHRPDMEVLEYHCTENNRNQLDSEGRSETLISR